MTRHLFKEFRAGFPACEIVVLTDLSTGTVLAWDSALKWPQDDLDALCARTGRLLRIGARGNPDEQASFAMLAHPGGTQIAVPAGGTRPEALCGVFAPGAPLDGVADTLARLCAELVGTLPGADRAT